MRITFVLPHAGMSGGVRVVAMHAKQLQQRGHRVCIVSTPHRWPNRRERARNFVHRVAMRMRGFIEPSHLSGTNLDHRVISHQPPVVDDDVPDADVVVATWWETAEWVAALSAQKGAKAYFIQGFETHHHEYEQRVLATWNLPMHKIVVAHWLEELAESEFGDRDVSIVLNGVELDHFRAEQRVRQAIPTVGLLYTTNHCKGVDLCLQAFAQAQRKVPSLRLVAFGSDTISPDLPLPTHAKFHHLPAQHELPLIYASCDAWLFGSRKEGFGLPILEAMACRTPVIATQAGAARELLADGGGLLLDLFDASAMADAIVEVVNLPNEQWRKMSDAAHRIAARHTWEAASRRFELALERAIKRDSKPRAQSYSGCECGT